MSASVARKGLPVPSDASERFPRGIARVAASPVLRDSSGVRGKRTCALCGGRDATVMAEWDLRAVPACERCACETVPDPLPSVPHNRGKTHCKHGHEFTAENTRWSKHGRICRACEAINYARRRQGGDLFQSTRKDL